MQDALTEKKEHDYRSMCMNGQRKEKVTEGMGGGEEAKHAHIAHIRIKEIRSCKAYSKR